MKNDELKKEEKKMENFTTRRDAERWASDQLERTEYTGAELDAAIRVLGEMAWRGEVPEDVEEMFRLVNEGIRS